MREYVKDEDGRVFADERTKISWDTAKAAEEIAETLPSEGLDLKPIYFEKEHSTRGWAVMLTMGRMVYTGGDGYWVSDKTRTILEALNIPYNHGFPEKEE